MRFYVIWENSHNKQKMCIGSLFCLRANTPLCTNCLYKQSEQTIEQKLSTFVDSDVNLGKDFLHCFFLMLYFCEICWANNTQKWNLTDFSNKLFWFCWLKYATMSTTIIGCLKNTECWFSFCVLTLIGPLWHVNKVQVSIAIRGGYAPEEF